MPRCAEHAGGFVDHYISSVLYANVSHQFQASLGLLLIALNVLIYLFVLSRRRRRIEYNYAATSAAELVGPERRERVAPGQLRR